MTIADVICAILGAFIAIVATVVMIGLTEVLV